MGAHECVYEYGCACVCVRACVRACVCVFVCVCVCARVRARAAHGRYWMGKLNLVDLAGSERQAKTQARSQCCSALVSVLHCWRSRDTLVRCICLLHRFQLHLPVASLPVALTASDRFCSGDRRPAERGDENQPVALVPRQRDLRSGRRQAAHPVRHRCTLALSHLARLVASLQPSSTGTFATFINRGCFRLLRSHSAGGPQRVLATASLTAAKDVLAEERYSTPLSKRPAHPRTRARKLDSKHTQQCCE